jgi:hypothetical protein
MAVIENLPRDVDQYDGLDKRLLGVRSKHEENYESRHQHSYLKFVELHRSTP